MTDEIEWFKDMHYKIRTSGMIEPNFFEDTYQAFKARLQAELLNRQYEIVKDENGRAIGLNVKD